MERGAFLGGGGWGRVGPGVAHGRFRPGRLSKKRKTFPDTRIGVY